MSKREHRKGSLTYKFVAVPHAILEGKEWSDLGFSARALVMALAAQYTGKNNGRLTPAFEALRKQGWTSKGTVIRAKKQLLELTTFTVQTRKGHAPSTAEWLAFTWWKLDYQPSMEVDPAAFHRTFYLNFQKSIDQARIDPNQGRQQARGNRLATCQSDTDKEP